MKNASQYISVLMLALIIIGLVWYIANQSYPDNNKSVPDKEEVTNSDVRIDPLSPTLPVTSISPMTKVKQYSKPPEMQIDPTKTYIATLETTEGTIILDLNAKNVPITVNNFVFLAKEGFYDGTIFHRIIEGFMIQGGDPRGDGTGGPGYKFKDEEFSGTYAAGTLAMANAGANTNGSQFFIMHEETPLPPNYVIFGNVQSGQDVVDAIATAPTKSNPQSREKSIPVNPVKILKVTISESK